MMNLKRRFARALMDALHPDTMQAIADDFVDWLYQDRSPAERREKARRITPYLIEWLYEGEIGLWPVLYQHLRRLPLARALDRRPKTLDSEVRGWMGEP